MSIAELKETADRLTAEERTWLRDYLWALERANNPAWRQEIEHRLQGMRQGNESSREQVLTRLGIGEADLK